jgi:hypothetical protein
MHSSYVETDIGGFFSADYLVIQTDSTVTVKMFPRRFGYNDDASENSLFMHLPHKAPCITIINDSEVLQRA